jgi:hypothetical protein
MTEQPRDPGTGQFRSKRVSLWATVLILFLLVACILAWP